jgi:predicted permease
VTPDTDSTRENGGDGFLDRLSRDLRNAWRAARSAKGFSVVVILTLALGIGGAATIFSVVDHVLIRPLQYPDADRLVSIFQQGKGGNLRLVSYPTLQDWSREDAGLSGLAWIRGDGQTVELPDGPQRLVVGFVSPGFFQVMQQGAALGRTLVPEEESPGGREVVVLSHDAWQKMFGGDTKIIGKSLRLDNSSVTVVGVMPDGFEYPSWAQSWRPVSNLIGRDPMVESRDFHADSRAIGRLKPGVDLERATRLLSSVQQRVAKEYPATDADWTGVQMTTVQTEIVGNIRSALLALSAAVALILLVACVNLANLAAVRGSSRGREVAIRLALGASRGQIARQLVTESLTLAVVGGAVGVLLAWQAVAWLRATAPFGLPRAGEISLDGRAVLVASAITIFTALLFGVVPALRAAMAGGSLSSLLGGRAGAGGSKREARGRAILTSAQFALALLLLVGAGLLAQSYRKLLNTGNGFDPHNLWSASMQPPGEAYKDAASAWALYQRILDRLKLEPGVEEVTVVNFMPSGGAGVPTRIEIPGRPADSQDLATYITASESFLRTMRIPLVRGRWFSDAEMRSPGDGIVVSETVANRYWPGADPIGKPITIHRSSQARPDFGRAVASTVIGVAKDVRQFGPGSPPNPSVYVPMSAEPWAWVSFAIRAREGAAPSVTALRRAVFDVEPRMMAVGPEKPATFSAVEDRLSASLQPRRYVLGMVGAFSACALLLAAIGLYGVASYAVTRRNHEFGIRIALGATPAGIVRSVVVWGVALAAIGCAIGLGGAFALVRLIQQLLFDTSPRDLTVLVTVPVLLIIIGTVSVWLPARRASRVDPIVALRSE